MLPSKRRPRDGAIDPRKDISGLGNSTRLTGPINWTKTDGIRAGAHFAPEPRDRGYGGAPRLAARGPSMAGEHDGKAPFFAVEKSRGDAAQRAFCPEPLHRRRPAVPGAAELRTRPRGQGTSPSKAARQSTPVAKVAPRNHRIDRFFGAFRPRAALRSRVLRLCAHAIPPAVEKRRPKRPTARAEGAKRLTG